MIVPNLLFLIITLPANSYECIDNLYEYDNRLEHINNYHKYFSHISYIESIDSNYTLKEFKNELTILLEFIIC